MNVKKKMAGYHHWLPVQNPEGFLRFIQNEQFWAHIWGLLVREIAIYWEGRSAIHSWGAPKAFQQLSWECFLSLVDTSLKKGHPVAGESKHLFSFGKEGTKTPSINVRGTGEGGYFSLKIIHMKTSKPPPQENPDVSLMWHSSDASSEKWRAALSTVPRSVKVIFSPFFLSLAKRLSCLAPLPTSTSPHHVAYGLVHTHPSQPLQSHCLALLRVTGRMASFPRVLRSLGSTCHLTAAVQTLPAGHHEAESRCQGRGCANHFCSPAQGRDVWIHTLALWHLRGESRVAWLVRVGVGVVRDESQQL